MERRWSVGGEVTTTAKIDYADVARRVYSDIGYSLDGLEVLDRVVKQSPEIAHGVNEGGAGDQGIMYGYATKETPELLPLGVVLSHKLAKGLEELRRSGELSWLRPDGKTQVTLTNGKVSTVLISTQHDEDISVEDVRREIEEKLVRRIVGEGDYKVIVNPAGAWSVGGFEADAGLTGRKIMVDTYGGLIPHGGGAFSGKDSTKVDRSGAYMARYVAQDIVSKGLADECLVSVAYAIGVVDPVMVSAVDGNGNDVSHLCQDYDFRPQKMIEYLKLREPIFHKTSCYGHFGKSVLPWG